MAGMKFSYILVLSLVLVSSGCAAESIEKDSVAGEVLQGLGVEPEGDSSSYDFSQESMANKALDAAMNPVLEQIRGEMSESGFSIETLDVEVLEISGDKAEVRVDYTASANESGVTVDDEVRLTFVREGSTWSLEGPVGDNLDTSQLSESPRP